MTERSENHLEKYLYHQITIQKGDNIESSNIWTRKNNKNNEEYVRKKVAEHLSGYEEEGEDINQMCSKMQQIHCYKHNE